jgi:hypothetical protein
MRPEGKITSGERRGYRPLIRFSHLSSAKAMIYAFKTSIVCRISWQCRPTKGRRCPRRRIHFRCARCPRPARASSDRPASRSERSSPSLRAMSRRGGIFIAIEDETGVANLVVWPSLFERQRRVVFSAGMMAVRGNRGPSCRASSHRPVRRSRQPRRPRRRLPAAARTRRSGPGRRRLLAGPARPAAARAPDAGHLHPGLAHRLDKGEDARFPVVDPIVAERGAQTRSPVIPFVPKVSDPRGPDLCKNSPEQTPLVR